MSQRISIEDILYHIFNAIILKRQTLACSLLSKKWRSVTIIHASCSLSLLVKSEKNPARSNVKINYYV